MELFNPEEFTLPPRTYPLCQFVEVGKDTDTFVKRYGFNWKRIPHLENVLYARDKEDRVHMTLLLRDGEPFEVALYDVDMPFAQWKQKFLGNELEAVYVNVESEIDMCHVLIERLKGLEAWT